MRITFFILLLSLTSFSQDDIDSLTFEKDSFINFYHPEPKYPGGMDSLKNFISQNLSVEEFSHFHLEESKKSSLNSSWKKTEVYPIFRFENHLE